MIDNIATLIGNSKVVSSIRNRKNIIDIQPSSSSIEEAKAKVQKIIDEGRSKRRKKKKSHKES